MPTHDWQPHLHSPPLQHDQQLPSLPPPYPAQYHFAPRYLPSSAYNGASFPLTNALRPYHTTLNGLTTPQGSPPASSFSATSAPYQQTGSARHVEYSQSHASHNPRSSEPTYDQAINPTKSSSPHPVHNVTHSQPPAIHTIPVSSTSVLHDSRPQPTTIHSSPLLPASAIGDPRHLPTPHLPAFPRPNTTPSGVLHSPSSTSSVPIYGGHYSPPRNRAIARIPLAKGPQASAESHHPKQLSGKATALKASSGNNLPTPLIPRFPPDVEDLDRLILGVEKHATKDEYVAVF